MAFQQIRGRCRVDVTDIVKYKVYENEISIYIFLNTFKKKYAQKAKKGTDLVILQGTNPLEENYRGVFTITHSSQSGICRVVRAERA